jgi:hypothetical protein
MYRFIKHLVGLYLIESARTVPNVAVAATVAILVALGTGPMLVRRWQLALALTTPFGLALIGAPLFSPQAPAIGRRRKARSASEAGAYRQRCRMLLKTSSQTTFLYLGYLHVNAVPGVLYYVSRLVSQGIRRFQVQDFAHLTRGKQTSRVWSF